MTPAPIDQWIAEAEARLAGAAPGPWAFKEFCGELLIEVPDETFALNHCPYEMTEARGTFIVEAFNTDLPRAMRLIRHYRDVMRQISANEHRPNAHDAELHLPWCAYPNGGCFCAKEAADRALAYDGEE